jgi:hypothetical protein
MAKVTGPGSYRLQTLEGEDVNNSCNVDQLCRFYAKSTRLPWGLKSTRLHQDPSAVSGLRVQALVSGLLLRCKRPPGPGTSLRTTPPQNPAHAATYGSRLATSDKGL